jgi:tetratricopeptide (TPR) repeat protein
MASRDPFRRQRSARYGPRVVELASYLYRALCLLGLAIAPRLMSPDPGTPKNAAIALFVPFFAFLALLVGAVTLKRRIESREARIAAGLVWVSVAAAIGLAIVFSGPRAPLALGGKFLAIVVWPTLAALAATLAGAFLGSNFKHKRTAAAALVIAGGLYVQGDAYKNMGDVAFMWKTTLDREPANEAAFLKVTRSLFEQGKIDEVNKRTAACLRVDPSACACLVAKVKVAQRRQDPEKAMTAGADAAKACPNVTAARAANAEALAMGGKLDDAMAEAEEALTLEDDPPRAHEAKATVLLTMGKVTEAEEELNKSAAAGGGHNTKLMIAQMQIEAGNLDAAENVLKALKTEAPEDANVQYDLALIADKRDKYNDARNGYLATLKLDPTYKQARYNLALLTFRRGVTEEAKNHARKFAAMAPKDPQVKPLMRMIFGTDSPPPPDKP